MVTPGVKLPFDDAISTDDEMPDLIDDMPVNRITHQRRVKFNMDVKVIEVPDQTTTYGIHPR